MNLMLQSKDLKENMTHTYAAYKRPMPEQKTSQTESEGLEKNIPSKGTGKKSGVAILISDKTDFKTKTIKRDTEGHFIIFKGRSHQEDINIANIYAPNIRASNM